VAVIKDGKEESRLTASVEAGTAEFFGERALLCNEPRGATVVTTSDWVKALALDRDSFNMLLGPLEDIIMQSQEARGGEALAKQRGKAAPRRQFGEPDRPHIDRGDLVRVGLLGSGGFSAVELWAHKLTGESYALKGISKGLIVQTGLQESVMNEKTAFMMTDSPFIIKLYETYNGTRLIYFLLEAALGGDLYRIYNTRGLFGSEGHAKFYSAAVVLAFEHMHERRIIYRDLKPENLMLSSRGHLKITDMGMAKFVIGTTYTTCGTPDYLAPEVLESTGHTNAVDWWCLGILIFELMTGRPPFCADYPMQTYAKIMKGISKVAFPQTCQGDVADLIKALLVRGPSERLPMRPGLTNNLKEHACYIDFGWDDMAARELQAPYVPVVQGKKDLSNFRARQQDRPKIQEYHDDGSTGPWFQDHGVCVKEFSWSR